MQSICNIIFWLVAIPFLIIIASIVVPIAIMLVVAILAIILGLSLFALPVLAALYLVQKVI